MKITFDDAIGLLKGINDPLWFSEEICKSAKIATDTMCKYQKIKTVIEMWKEDKKRFILGNNGSKDEYLRQISEVLEEGNDEDN